MVKKRKVGRIVLAVFLMLIVLTCATIPIANNLIAYGIKKDLERCPLPEGAEFCAAISAAGKLNGNGNGMQYLGAILLQSDLNLQEIINHYSKFRTDDWDYLVQEQKGNKVDIVEHKDISFNSPIDENDSYYVVYTWGTTACDFLIFADIRGY